jgi:hypothetical protein
MVKSIRPFLLILVLLFQFSSLSAQTYFFEYGILTDGGALASSPSYRIVDAIANWGISQGVHSSDDYLITPLAGLDMNKPYASCWMLY